MWPSFSTLNQDNQLNRDTILHLENRWKKPLSKIYHILRMSLKTKFRFVQFAQKFRFDKFVQNFPFALKSKGPILQKNFSPNVGALRFFSALVPAFWLPAAKPSSFEVSVPAALVFSGVKDVRMTLPSLRITSFLCSPLAFGLGSFRKSKMLWWSSKSVSLLTSVVDLQRNLEI